MFANRIKYLRLSKELNQVQLAERLGVKKQSISNWENDNIQPSVDMLLKIVRLYSVSADYLLGIDDRNTVDVTGLNNSQIAHIQMIIDDIRKAQ